MQYATMIYVHLVVFFVILIFIEQATLSLA